MVSSITWTASGEGIKAGEFDEFEVSVGPLPEVESLTFPAVQTYADGTEVAWVQEAQSDGSEPEHPAPTLTLNAATQSDIDAAAAEPVVEKETDNGLAIVAIVISVAALLVSLAVVVRGRSRPRP